MNHEAIIKLFPKSLIKEQLPFFDEAFAYAALTTKERIALFLAQVGHESQGFTRVRENLNYGAQGLANTWPSRYAVNSKATPKVPNWIAKTIERQPEVIANITYADRMGNGNVQSGDGWRFRGGGDMMLTGKDAYELFDAEFNMNGKIVANPNMIIEPYWAIMSAASYWKRNKLNRFADASDIEGSRAAINGGLIGLEKVILLHDQITRIL